MYPSAAVSIPPMSPSVTVSRLAVGAGFVCVSASDDSARCAGTTQASVGLISPNAFTTVVDGGVWTSATCATPTPSPPPPSLAPSPPPPPPPPLLVASSGAARARRSSNLEPFWTWFAVAVLAWAGLSVCVFGALAARRRRREVVSGRD